MAFGCNKCKKVVCSCAKPCVGCYPYNLPPDPCLEVDTRITPLVPPVVNCVDCCSDCVDEPTCMSIPIWITVALFCFSSEICVSGDCCTPSWTSTEVCYDSEGSSGGNCPPNMSCLAIWTADEYCVENDIISNPCDATPRWSAQATCYDSGECVVLSPNWTVEEHCVNNDCATTSPNWYAEEVCQDLCLTYGVSNIDPLLAQLVVWVDCNGTIRTQTIPINGNITICAIAGSIGTNGSLQVTNLGACCPPIWQAAEYCVDDSVESCQLIEFLNEANTVQTVVYQLCTSGAVISVNLNPNETHSACLIPSTITHGGLVSETILNSSCTLPPTFTELVGNLIA